MCFVTFIVKQPFTINYFSGEVFDYLVAHGRMKEKEARAKFRQVSGLCTCTVNLSLLIHQFSIGIK